MLRDPTTRFALAVNAAGTAALAAAVATGAFSDMSPSFSLAALAALVILTEKFPLRVPLQSGDVRITASNLFSIAILAVHGLGAALAVAVLSMVAHDFRRRLPPIKVAFNSANLVLACCAAAVALELGLLAGALALVLVNNLLTGIVCSLSLGVSVRTTLLRDTHIPVLIDITLAVFSPVVVLVAADAPVLLPLLLVPLGSMLYSGQVADSRRHDALHDPLTGLPNRVLFGRHVDQELHRVQTAGEACAVLMLDLDRFKDVNDTLGHAKGDVVLRSVGETLRRAVRDDDVVARLSGDEFGVLIKGNPNESAAVETAERLRAVLSEPIDLGGLRLSAGASLGVTMSTTADEDAGALLRRADVAMYSAKERGQGVCLYDAAADPNTAERLGMAAQLREGIHRGELVLHYQPKVWADDGTVEGVEALVRWQHPDRGLIFPGDFLPLAERTDLMKPLTMAVLEQALCQVAQWRATGLELHVAVNLSAETLLDRRLAAEIAGLLERFGTPPQSLQLELTESSLMRDPKRSAEVLEEISASGVRIAIDDFGTGWSSLVWLKRLPIDVIKIDRSFVGDMLGSPNDAAIVESTINLGQTLELEVVAEGVETAEALDQLREFGCDIVQGYLICRPKPADELTPWLIERGQTARYARA